MVLHGAPGAQSPKQEFTGHVDYPGFYTAENYERANQFLEWMAERIHTNEGYRSVFMLEVLNEPIRTWEYPDLAADMIANFYPAAWSRIRAKESELGVAESNQLYIQMMGDIWGSGDPKSKLADTNFAKFDDHRYYKWDSSVTKTKDGYMTAACNDDRGDNIIGEWTISVADDVQDNGEFNIDGSPAEQVDWYQKFWAAQAQTFEKSGGWIFWSWKCDWIGGKDDWRWCYESAVAAGAIPKDASSASSISPC
ncbi:hypothetical protein SLS62_008053 [Diatrype stigma]|uniref:Uncharacterized protein n=1 Tax=Diatrype stigma TaxID=117547 RepID=A0AAN9UL68_9PEZI